MVKDQQRLDESYYKPLVYGHCARKKYINADCRYSGLPPKHSMQNASAVQLGVSQHIGVVAATGVQGRRSTSSPFIRSHCK